MNKLILIILIGALTGPFSFAFAATDIGDQLSRKETFSENAWEDFKTSFSWIFKGGVNQFRTKSSLYILAAGAPALWYAFEEDKEYAQKNRTKGKPPGWIRSFHGISVASTFSIQSFALYSISHWSDNEKLRMYAMELFAATNLTLAETFLFSFIPIHERPDTSDLSHWETNFRGDSSFPSGHMVPFAVWTYKTFQYYGPLWALLPASAFAVSSYQRVRENKHYLSDVVGSIILSGLASEGVRVTANYHDNHPVYKWMYEHEVSVGGYILDGNKYLYTSASF